MKSKENTNKVFITSEVSNLAVEERARCLIIRDKAETGRDDGICNVNLVGLHMAIPLLISYYCQNYNRNGKIFFF